MADIVWHICIYFIKKMGEDNYCICLTFHDHLWHIGTTMTLTSSNIKNELRVCVLLIRKSCDTNQCTLRINLSQYSKLLFYFVVETKSFWGYLNYILSFVISYFNCVVGTSKTILQETIGTVDCILGMIDANCFIFVLWFL